MPNELTDTVQRSAWRPANTTRILFGIAGAAVLGLAGVMMFGTIACGVSFRQPGLLAILLGGVGATWMLTLAVRKAWLRILLRALAFGLCLWPFIPHRTVEWSSPFPPAGFWIWSSLKYGRLQVFEFVSILVGTSFMWLGGMAMHRAGQKPDARLKEADTFGKKPVEEAPGTGSTGDRQMCRFQRALPKRIKPLFGVLVVLVGGSYLWLTLHFGLGGRRSFEGFIAKTISVFSHDKRSGQQHSETLKPRPAVQPPPTQLSYQRTQPRTGPENPEVQYNLGLRFANGQGVTKSYMEAVKWYRKAAEQGHARAQNSLGYCYWSGQGVTQDYAQAVEWYRKAAEQNLAWAQYNLGVCHANGQGLMKDDEEAVRWFRKAADRNHPMAQNNLGVHYTQGRGVVKDQVEALGWYRKAAEQNHSMAQNNLGNCYARGRGVAKDEVEAYKWRWLAAAQGNESAKKALPSMEGKLSEAQIAEGKQRADDWIRQHRQRTTVDRKGAEYQEP